MSEPLVQPEPVPVLERRLLSLSAVAVACLAGFLALRANADRERIRPLEVQPSPQAPADLRVDLNSADESMLEHLPGLGRKRAKDIVANREQHGPFRTPQDVMRVSGIKDATFSQFAAYVRTCEPTVGGGTSATPDRQEPQILRRKSTRKK